MPPKKHYTQAEEVDDIKRSLDMLTEEVSAVRQKGPIPQKTEENAIYMDYKL